MADVPTFYPYSELPRLAASPWRDKLERSSSKRGFDVRWLSYAIGDYVRTVVNVFNRDQLIIKQVGVTSLSTSYDPAAMAERVAELVMDPW